MSYPTQGLTAIHGDEDKKKMAQEEKRMVQEENKTQEESHW